MLTTHISQANKAEVPKPHALGHQQNEEKADKPKVAFDDMMSMLAGTVADKGASEGEAQAALLIEGELPIDGELPIEGEEAAIDVLSLVVSEADGVPAGEPEDIQSLVARLLHGDKPVGHELKAAAALEQELKQGRSASDVLQALNPQFEKVADKVPAEVFQAESLSAEEAVLATESEANLEQAISADVDATFVSDDASSIDADLATDELLLDAENADEVNPLTTPVVDASELTSEEVGEKAVAAGHVKAEKALADEADKQDAEAIEDAAELAREQQVAMEVVEQQKQTQGNSAPAAGTPASQAVTSPSTAAANSVTSWGTQSSEVAQAQAGNQGQQPGQGNSQQGGSPQSQQQAMQFAQAVKEMKETAIEQQMAVKATDDAAAKTDGKDSLLGAEFATSERRGALPLGLQTINLPVKHPQWGQAFGQRVVFMANQSLQQAQITLNPEKLGKIQVLLKMDKDQVMNVSLAAQNGMTREAIENALPRLREMLEQAGINLGNVDISEQKQFAENGAQEDNGSEGSAAGNSKTGDDSVTDESETVVSASDSLVDYYV